MHTEISQGSELHKSFIKGARIARDAVAPTMGPKGRNSARARQGRSPEVSNDGKKILSWGTLKNQYEQMSFGMAQDIAKDVAKDAGDNTSSATVLYDNLVEQGFKKITMGANPVFFRQGMEKASEDLVADLKAQAVPHKGKTDTKNIATSSSESENIGKMMADIVDQIGKDGKIVMEESKTAGVSCEITLGMKIQSGYMTEYMVTDAAKKIAEVKTPYILVTDKKLSNFQEIFPLIQKVSDLGKKEMVIIADDVTGDAIDNININRVRGAINIVCIKAPGYGESKKDFLEDIAILVGTTVIQATSEKQITTMTVKDLGMASVVSAGQESTDILGGKGKKADVDAYVALLKKHMQTPEISDFEKQSLEDRIASLTGGMAIIKIGSENESDLIYLKDKIEDTIASVKGGIEEGTLIGGGLALIRAGRSVKIPSGDPDFVAGYKTVLEALDVPFTCIIENTGRKDPQVLLNEILSSSGNKGYNAKDGVMVPDMFKAGIVDTLKSIRIALAYAVKGAAILLTIEVGFAEEKDKEL